MNYEELDKELTLFVCCWYTLSLKGTYVDRDSEMYSTLANELIQQYKKAIGFQPSIVHERLPRIEATIGVTSWDKERIMQQTIRYV